MSPELVAQIFAAKDAGPPYPKALVDALAPLFNQRQPPARRPTKP